MATITVRQLDTNWDPIAGNGQSNFLTDIDAVAQIIAQRIKLLQGEWWENINAGTPLFQSILGAAGSGSHPQTIALLLSQRILGTPYVTGVSNVSTSYNASTRAFQFSCAVETQFGTLGVSL